MSERNPPDAAKLPWFEHHARPYVLPTCIHAFPWRLHTARELDGPCALPHLPQPERLPLEEGGRAAPAARGDGAERQGVRQDVAPVPGLGGGQPSALRRPLHPQEQPRVRRQRRQRTARLHALPLPSHGGGQVHGHHPVRVDAAIHHGGAVPATGGFIHQNVGKVFVQDLRSSPNEVLLWSRRRMVLSPESQLLLRRRGGGLGSVHACI